MRRISGWLWKALILLACVGYQVVVHSMVASGNGGVARLAFALLPLLALGYWVARRAQNKLRWCVVISAAAVAVFAIERLGGFGLPAMNALTHAGINGFMLWIFARTLVGRREALITGLARRFHGTLPPHIESYTRRVTVMWCVFFVAQILVSGVLFAFFSLNTWSLFVNVLSLPLVVATFVGEYIYRVIRYRSYEHVSILKGIQVFADRRTPPVPPSGAVMNRSVARDVNG